MKKLTYFLLLFLITTPLFAQIETVWEKSAAASALPSWFSASGNTERGFAFGNVESTPRLFVVSRNAGTFVRMVNAMTGADAGQLSTTGVSGGTFGLNDFGVSMDGKMYGVNLANSLADPFKIYHWASTTADPTVAFQSDFGVDKRMGDNFAISGMASDNSLKIWAADAKGNRVIVFKTTDNGVTFTQDFIITLPATTFGGAPSVYPLLEDSLILINSSGRNVQAYTWGGAFYAAVPGGQISTATTTTVIAPVGQNGFITAFQYGAGTMNARLVDTQGDDPAFFRTYAITPSLGANANVNGTGDIDFYRTGDDFTYLYVLSTNNGFGCYKISTPMMVNGRMHENYWHLADAQNQNRGFGPNIYVNRLRYRVEGGKLYLGVESRLDKTNNNGIAVFLRLSNLSGQGAAAGTSLGGVPSGGHLFGAGANPNFKNDFETHYAFVLNPGGSDSVIYIDAAKYTSTTKQGAYLGSARMDGGARQGPGPGSFFTENSITFAFDSAYGERRGLEIAFPLSELGGAVTADNISVFAVVVSSTAFFSDVTVPGNVTGGNPGFDVNWANVGGGPYNTMPRGLPVELAAFTANSSGSSVHLQWSTASETNNSGFEIQRSTNGTDFTGAGFVAGRGNTAELSSYTFTEEVSAGIYYYRLKQIDFDGSYSFSGIVTVQVGESTPVSFDVAQNFPNPFNPDTEIRYSVPANGHVVLAVFDALGSRVAVLQNGLMNAGYHTARFNASGLASGTYIYRLTYTMADGVTKSIDRKMTLLK